MQTDEKLMEQSLRRACEELVELQQQNALLRQALEAVEFIPPEYSEIFSRCAWCRGLAEHHPGCLRQRALGIEKEG